MVQEILSLPAIPVSAGALIFDPAGRLAGIRYLFDCGQVSDEALADVKLQPEEISDSRLVSLTEAFTLLRGPISRRVQAATQGHFYLEDGRPAL